MKKCQFRYIYNIVADNAITYIIVLNILGSNAIFLDLITKNPLGNT